MRPGLAAGRRRDAAAPSVPSPVREATRADNLALVRLAAACPMKGAVALCVERAPDFFALSRLQGTGCQVGIVDGSNGVPAGVAGGCVSMAERAVYLHGRPARTIYLSDLKVHPALRGGPAADALSVWVRNASREAGGNAVPSLVVVLAGNRSMERRAPGPRGLPILNRFATLRSFSIPLAWPRREPREAAVRIRRGRRGDLEAMAYLWGRVAPARQFAPVMCAESLAHFVTSAPGLELDSYRLAVDRAGRLQGFLGFWNQSSFKQMRVQRYAPALALTRRVFNGLAPITGATPLAPEGGVLHYLSGVHLCVPPDAPEVLRALLLRAYAEARGGHPSFLSVGLDARDPLCKAMRGLWAQEVLIHAYITMPGGVYSGAPLDDRPLHFETALV